MMASETTELLSKKSVLNGVRAAMKTAEQCEDELAQLILKVLETQYSRDDLTFKFILPETSIADDVEWQ